jgi:thiol-disulfide isomerase/thioredoxin
VLKKTMTARLVLSMACLLVEASGMCGDDDNGQPTPAKPRPSDWAGKPAPALVTGELFNGPAELSLDKLRGKVVLVNFWITSCPVCVKKLPRLEALHNKYKDGGLVVIGIHPDEERDGMGDWLKDRHVTYPIAIDKGDTLSRYAINEWPTYFLIDQAGNIVWGLTKEPPTDKQIEELLPK